MELLIQGYHPHSIFHHSIQGKKAILSSHYTTRFAPLAALYNHRYTGDINPHSENLSLVEVPLGFGSSGAMRGLSQLLPTQTELKK